MARQMYGWGTSFHVGENTSAAELRTWLRSLDVEPDDDIRKVQAQIMALQQAIADLRQPDISATLEAQRQRGEIPEDDDPDDYYDDYYRQRE